MDTENTTYRMHQCCKCPGGKEYYCESCPCDLCPKCKENHVKDLQTIDHNVVSHRDKINYIPTQEICVRHPSNVYIKYCELCQVPVCDSCPEYQSHRFRSFLFGQGQHNILDIHIAYKQKQQQHRATIHSIRSEALFYRPFLLTGINGDFKTCRTELSLYQSNMFKKAKTLKDLINDIQNDFMCNVFCEFNFKHRCLKQKMEMHRHIVSLQKYVHIYEQRVIRPIKFLSSIKKALRQLHLTLHTSQLSMTESLKKEDVMESLSIQITERGNRRVGNESILKLMFASELQQSFTVTDVDSCHHISCVTSDQVWVSDYRNNLILTNTSGVIIHRIEDFCSGLYGGSHTMNSENELIYIDKNYNINKLSKDMKRKSTVLERTDYTRQPRCVYWSLSTGDLLVGMYYVHEYKGKVIRYNKSGQLTKTMQYDKTGRMLYIVPHFITENKNGDVVVCSYNNYNALKSGAVVVTDHGGRHRFSYRKAIFGSELQPSGICTDALSHILICDKKTFTVQMIDRDGEFLSFLLIKSQDMGKPLSLSYDFNTHRLWVGSENKVCVFRYITRQDALTDQIHVMESMGENLTTATEKSQPKKKCPLKMMSSPKLLESFKLQNVHCYRHISYVTSDQVWVSDDENNLILTNTLGVILRRVQDVFCGFFNGAHTVNGENELIYIDRKFKITKLSKDMKTTTTFIERTESTWEPRCVYWSPLTGDLLVAMVYVNIESGKVTRYNQSGQQTQTIKIDKGRELYTTPIYITENKNGDILVCDLQGGVLVVTERGGRHRFNYTGLPSLSTQWLLGVCTDALSHILVSELFTTAIHMLDKDGQFLSYLLTKTQDGPHSLSYDFNTHRLWIGSLENNMISVYRYITRQDALKDEHTDRPDGDAIDPVQMGMPFLAQHQS